MTCVQFSLILITQILFMADVMTPFDSEGYNACFEDSGFTIWEPTFQLICDFTSSMNDKFYSLMLGRLISVTPILTLLFIVSKRDLYASTYLFLVIFGLILGGYRQLIAVSILGIAFVLYDKFNIKKFILTFLAFSTHYSSIVAASAYLIFRNLKLSKIQLLLIFISLLFFPYFTNYLILLNFFNYIYIPNSWIQYLTGTYVVADTDYYLFAKLILISQSALSIFVVTILSKRSVVGKNNVRLLVILESLFIVSCLSVGYIITARFAIYIRLLEMRFILMESYSKQIKLTFIFIAFSRLSVLLYGSSF